MKLKIQNKLLDESGISLIEVIASIVIISIILIAFMNFFPQMAKSNNQTGEKQQAINLASSELLFWQNTIDEEFMEKAKNLPDSSLANSDLTPYLKAIVNNIEKVQNPTNSIIILTTSTNSIDSMKNDYDVEVLLKIDPDLTTTPLKANSIQINIYKENSIQNDTLVSGAKPISTTYGYVFLKDE